MAQQTIGIGTAANDGTGDPIRTSFTKTNANFTELYGYLTNLPGATSDRAAKANGSGVLEFTTGLLLPTVSSQVNEITLSGAVTTANPSLAATGTDTNISLQLTGKGTGGVKIASGSFLFAGDGTTAGVANTLSLRRATANNVPFIHMTRDSVVNWQMVTGGTTGASVDLVFTNDASGKLLQVGEIGATAEITAFFSDPRLKKDVKQIDSKYALESVLSWKGITYKPNARAVKLSKCDPNQIHAGFLSTDLEATSPELIRDAMIGHGYKTVKYENTTAYLAEAIRELNNQHYRGVDALLQEIAALRAEVARLRVGR